MVTSAGMGYTLIEMARNNLETSTAEFVEQAAKVRGC
jgi:hypothetical protein